jgi:two-component system nitrogen regulation sensor histidine kinase GlnL
VFAGLELLATAVVALDEAFVVRFANPAAESLLATGAKSLIGQPFPALFEEREALATSLREARTVHWDYAAQHVTYGRPGREPLPLSCTIARVDLPGYSLLAELRPIEQELRFAREERLVSEQQANRELIRNLAHEIRNPLGGLRGSAQLLERELERSDLREYTQVIIKEADRLQQLMDRMLTPHRQPRIEPVGIHEVLERVRSLVKAEFGTEIERDYDPSLPEVLGDREQLIQALLNIARNALLAVGERGRIVIRTRIAANVNIGTVRHKLAASVSVEDNGPGVPPEIADTIFFPLVTGRANGTGLGLAVSQDLVTRHGGLIEFESKPGRTVFTILLPLPENA